MRVRHISDSELDELIDDVPDVNRPSNINYWVKRGDEHIYLEGWCDKCLAGTGFPPMERGGTAEKIAYMEDLTPEILARKAQERGLELIEGGFKEIEDAEHLYGVTWGVYREKPTGGATIPPNRRDRRREMRPEEITQLAKTIADHFRALEADMVRDIVIGAAMGEGAIPLHSRENRREPCYGCRIDPSRPLEAGNTMATTSGAIGTLSASEVRDWCSELVEVGDGRCERARGIREAAHECKKMHPLDTQAFFGCYIPKFSQIVKRQ